MGDDPTATPKSHYVLIGSRESSPTHKNKENKIKYMTYKIDKYVHKLTHSSKTQSHPINNKITQTNTTKNM